MEIALWLVLIVVTVVAVAALAERWRTSAPLLLVLVGIAASFLPFLPQVELEPELVLVGILPPLLFSAAYNTSFIDFRARKGTIASLSVGLVIFTTLVVGLVAWWLIPDIPLAAGFALGAVVAPPDAVAATAIARRVGMPQPIVQVLEGESLVNDATALTALRTAIAAVAGTVTVIQVGFGFLLAAGGGIVVGVIIALLYVPVRRRITTPAFDTALSFTVPYLAFVPAEELHASGVVAVVVAGLLIGHKAPLVSSGTARLTTEANWRTVSFLLENVVFLLIGLQLPALVRALGDDDIAIGVIAAAAAGVYLATVVTRFVWVFAGGWLQRRSWFGSQSPDSDRRDLTVISWAGMRGVVTLAAALTLPVTFHNRSALIFIAFVVVVASLLIQGATLPWLVRRLRLPPPDPRELALEEAALLDRAAEAGDERLGTLSDGVDDDLADRLRARSDDRRNGAWERVARPGAAETPIEAYTRLRLEMLGAERDAVLAARDDGGFTDEAVRRVIRLLDVEEGMLDSPAEAAGRADTELSAPESLTVTCEHLAAAHDQPPAERAECVDCVVEGSTWVHLRQCLTCGELRCCDSSPRTHATRHFAQSEHPVMQSAEPGESWRWCYVDRLLGG
ncbi:MAG: Na+/H+ antiporter [Candidatus Nanopelagicales bacterium]